jgi:predicted transposase YbfD/YdcC
MYNETKDFFETAFANDFNYVPHNYYEEHDAGHGRIEFRQCWTLTPNSEYFSSLDKWVNLKSLVMIKSSREFKGNITQETRFFITSLEPNAKKILNSVRKHWEIENSLHWTLDMTFREDESRIRAEASPENYAVARHITLNILKHDTTRKVSMKRKRFMAALEDDYRETLIKQVI